jgi:ketosteroid isomerase-like protein
MVTMTTLTTDDRNVIQRFTEAEWTTGMLTRDWSQILAMCADDIVYMPADHPVVRGHAALRAWLEQFPPIVRFSQPLGALEGQGDLAISHATFAVTVDIAGTPLENTGKVLCAWQRGASGQWLVKSVCWNWDRALSSGA